MDLGMILVFASLSSWTSQCFAPVSPNWKHQPTWDRFLWHLGWSPFMELKSLRWHLWNHGTSPNCCYKTKGGLRKKTSQVSCGMAQIIVYTYITYFIIIMIVYNCWTQFVGNIGCNWTRPNLASRFKRKACNTDHAQFTCAVGVAK